MIFYVLAGLAVGICAGLYFPVYIPPEYGKMLSVALMAALDTAFGGIRSSMVKKQLRNDRSRFGAANI